MTTEQTPPPLETQTITSSSPPKPKPIEYVAIQETSFSHILDLLLKKPLSIIYEIKHRDHPQSIQPHLLIVTLIGLSIFGFVLGMFSNGHQMWIAPIKVISGVLFSSLICLPSLYIFGALGGMDAKIQHIIGIMQTFLALTALLLIGFAPVLWLFSTSSNSSFFFGFLSITLWITCLLFGLRVITQACKALGGNKGFHIKVWAAIFITVTLQMTTTLRPIIGSSEQIFDNTEKYFFLGHWLNAASQ